MLLLLSFHKNVFACWPLPLPSYLSYMYTTAPPSPSFPHCHPPLLLPPLPPLPSPSILYSHFPLGSPTSTSPRSDRPANNHPYPPLSHLSTCPLKNAMEGREASGHPNHITGAYVEGGGGAGGERPATQAFFCSSTSSRVRP